MKRKIIKQGNGTLTITLPIKWAKKEGLTGKSEVEIIEEQGKLTVLSKSKPDAVKKKAHIKISGKYPEEIQTITSNAYKIGIDELKLELTSQNEVEFVRESMQDLIGFQITEAHKNSCIIQMIAEPSKDSQKSLPRRAFLMQKEIFISTLSFLKNRNEEDRVRVRRLTEEVKSITNLLRRLLNKSKNGGEEAKSMYVLLLRLAMFAHYSRELVNNLSTTPTKLSSIKFFSQLIKDYEAFYSSFFKKDVTAVTKVQQRDIELSNKVRRALLKSSGEETIILTYTLILSTILGISAGPFASLTIKSIMP